LQRVVGPVVAPADDYVAAGDGVAVVAEIAALEFEFEVDALPALGADLALGFAVREAGLNGFDDVAQFFCDDAEEEDDALFVDGFVAEAAEVDGAAVDRAATQVRVADFDGRRRMIAGSQRRPRAKGTGVSALGTGYQSGPRL